MSKTSIPQLQGKTTELKETVLGTEVFGRKPGYDTHTDPVVRMEASKLRARLGEYYAGPGVDDPVRIEIPKGAYTPHWLVREDARRPRAWRWDFPQPQLGSRQWVSQRRLGRRDHRTALSD